jgi:hypothetical protein
MNFSKLMKNNFISYLSLGLGTTRGNNFYCLYFKL